MWDWVATLVGLALLVAILLDVLLTVVHIDVTGPIAAGVQRAIWSFTNWLSQGFRTARRPLIAFAGPVMLGATFLVWMALFILAAALIVWPRLDVYRADPEFDVLTFTDALYYSGITANVLGYGDISPLTVGMQFFAVALSGLGFALLTGVITYILNITSGVTERNALAIHVQDMTGRTEDGVHALIRYLKYEDLSDVRIRLTDLSQSLNSQLEKFRHFPILDIYYRSQDPALDIEVMLRSAGDMAIAGRLIAQEKGAFQLRPAAEDLDQAVIEVMSLITSQYLDQELQNQIASPSPEQQDRQRMTGIQQRLHRHLSHLVEEDSVDRSGEDEALIMVARIRLFLEGIDGLTSWRIDHPEDEQAGRSD